MARTASPSHRQQLEQMAETWEQLAGARKHKLEKQGISEEIDNPKSR
jgi:ferric-dicitrate binding protein FerR (iron transport regulator)